MAASSGNAVRPADAKSPNKTTKPRTGNCLCQGEYCYSFKGKKKCEKGPGVCDI